MKLSSRNFEDIIVKDNIIFHDSHLLSFDFNIDKLTMNIIFRFLGENPEDDKDIEFSFIEIMDLNINFFARREDESWEFELVDYVEIKDNNYTIAGIKGWTINFSAHSVDLIHLNP